MAAVRHLENLKCNIYGIIWARKTNEVSFPTDYGITIITITLEWLFYSFGYSLASTVNPRLTMSAILKMHPIFQANYGSATGRSLLVADGKRMIGPRSGHLDLRVFSWTSNDNALLSTGRWLRRQRNIFAWVCGRRVPRILPVRETIPTTVGGPNDVSDMLALDAYKQVSTKWHTVERSVLALVAKCLLASGVGLKIICVELWLV